MPHTHPVFNQVSPTRHFIYANVARDETTSTRPQPLSISNQKQPGACSLRIPRSCGSPAASRGRRRFWFCGFGKLGERSRSGFADRDRPSSVGCCQFLNVGRALVAYVPQGRAEGRAVEGRWGLPGALIKLIFGNSQNPSALRAPSPPGRARRQRFRKKGFKCT